MSSFRTKPDERFCQVAFDPAKRSRLIRTLAACRKVSIVFTGLTILCLAGVWVTGVVRGGFSDTPFVLVFAVVVFQLTLLCHLDAQLKVLRIVGRLLEEQNRQQPEQTG